MTNYYEYVVLDPHPQSAEIMANFLAENNVFGIEVTVSSLAAQCVANLDHHGELSTCPPAIMQALALPVLPVEGMVLATIRPDLDSVGAMAVICLRSAHVMFEPACLQRIDLIARADIGADYAATHWRPQVLPSRENPWPNPSEHYSLAAIAAAVADFKLPLEQRVQLMHQWLLTGEEPADYRARVDAERQELITALEGGSIQIQTNTQYGFTTVISQHRAATTIGYAFSPVVIAFNPAFKAGQAEPYAKYTICQHSDCFLDLAAVFAALSLRELGWGGSATIGGSPQGVSSRLRMEEVIAVVKRHLVR